MSRQVHHNCFVLEFYHYVVCGWIQLRPILMMNLTVVTAQKHGLIIALDPDGVVAAVAVKVIHDFVSVNKCQIRQGLGRSHFVTFLLSLFSGE